MPSFSNYKKYRTDLFNGEVLTSGQAKKHNSDALMEESWWRDIGAQVAYIYDYYHDSHKDQLNGLEPKDDPLKTPIDIKYIVSTTQTYSKDRINYHLQLRPSQRCNVDYYDEFFAKRYQSEFPVGLYVDILDNRGVYNKWLIVGLANFDDPQFSTYEILRCDKVFNWIYDNKKYICSGVQRTQNSYQW